MLTFGYSFFYVRNFRMACGGVQHPVRCGILQRPARHFFPTSERKRDVKHIYRREKRGNKGNELYIHAFFVFSYGPTENVMCYLILLCGQQYKVFNKL